MQKDREFNKLNKFIYRKKKTEGTETNINHKEKL